MGHKLKAALGAAVCAFLCGLCLPNRAFAQTLPDGKGKAEFVHNCTACHRADMVTAVKKTPEEWRKSVDEMAARGTDGSKEDLDNVVLYLVTNYSSDKSAPAQTPASSAPGGPAMLNLFDREEVKIQAAFVPHRMAPARGSTYPARFYERKVMGEDLNSLIRYLLSRPSFP